VAADSVDEVAAGGDAGAGATPTERRARAPAVCVRAVALDRRQTRRPVATTHRVQPTTHPFNGPLSGTTQVSRYQEGKTNLDFTEARDSE